MGQPIGLHVHLNPPPSLHSDSFRDASENSRAVIIIFATALYTFRASPPKLPLEILHRVVRASQKFAPSAASRQEWVEGLDMTNTEGGGPRAGG
ncbi:hypothetical protein KM043_005415 [Ampulex compressa]|nr:hypothetical protein KM043_005415 [Ampulex compressa]